VTLYERKDGGDEKREIKSLQTTLLFKSTEGTRSWGRGTGNKMDANEP